jgi:hypothetical protein
MSRISNRNFNPGETTSVVDLNAKFTDVGTATAAINADNVRHEAVDMGNVDWTTGVVEATTSHEATVTTTFACATAPATVTTTAAFAARVWNEDIDYNRIYWSVSVTDVGGSLLATAASAAAGQRDGTGSLCWLIWPEIATDAGLTVWRVLPDQENGLGSTAAISNFPDIRADKSPSMMPIPAVLRVDKTNFAGTGDDYRVPPSNTTATYTRGYINTTGADITYYGIRLRIQGVYRGFTSGGNSYFENEQNATMGEDEYNNNTLLNITIGTATIINILMAKD